MPAPPSLPVALKRGGGARRGESTLRRADSAIADIVWAVITIFDATGAASTPCAEDSNIWMFCMVAVIVLPLAGALINILSAFATSAGVVIQVSDGFAFQPFSALPHIRPRGPFPQSAWLPPPPRPAFFLLTPRPYVTQMIPSVVNLVISVWGMLMWANMTDECMSMYNNDYSHLLLLFKINVIIMAISAVILLCVVCIGAAALTAAITQGSGTSRYENIPDQPGGGDAPSGDSAKLTEEYV